MQPNIDPAYLESQDLSPSTPVRFISKVSVAQNGCWIWTASKDTGGYGQLSRGGARRGKSLRASVISWIIYHGPVPAGLEVTHKCPDGANKLCVNPEHLKADTHANNMKDEAGKLWHTKHSPLPSETVGKLTQSQVDEIRKRYTGKRGEQSALAREFGVKQGTFWYIVNHITWAR